MDGSRVLRIPYYFGSVQLRWDADAPCINRDFYLSEIFLIDASRTRLLHPSTLQRKSRYVCMYCTYRQCMFGIPGRHTVDPQGGSERPLEANDNT